MGYMKRGDEAQLKAVFDKYASANIDGVRMSCEELGIFFENLAYIPSVRQILLKYSFLPVLLVVLMSQVMSFD